MKRLFFFLGVLAVVVTLLSSCGVQRDCQGNKHYRQKNGIYL